MESHDRWRVPDYELCKFTSRDAAGWLPPTAKETAFSVIFQEARSQFTFFFAGLCVMNKQGRSSETEAAADHGHL